MAQTMSEYLLSMLDIGELDEALEDCSDFDHLPVDERVAAMKRRRYYRRLGKRHNNHSQSFRVAQMRRRNGC
jgi:hypothetical protein